MVHEFCAALAARCVSLAIRPDLRKRVSGQVKADLQIYNHAFTIKLSPAFCCPED